jgi:hypothetical protein
MKGEDDASRRFKPRRQSLGPRNRVPRESFAPPAPMSIPTRERRADHVSGFNSVVPRRITLLVPRV